MDSAMASGGAGAGGRDDLDSRGGRGGHGDHGGRVGRVGRFESTALKAYSARLRLVEVGGGDGRGFGTLKNNDSKLRR